MWNLYAACDPRCSFIINIARAFPPPFVSQRGIDGDDAGTALGPMSARDDDHHVVGVGKTERGAHLLFQHIGVDVLGL